MVAATFNLQADVAAIVGRPIGDASVLIEPLADEAGDMPVVDPTTGKMYVSERYELGRTASATIALPKPTAMAPTGYQYRATVRYREADGRYFKSLPPITFSVPADTVTLKLGLLADTAFVPPIYVPALLTARDEAVAAAGEADASATAAAGSAADAESAAGTAAADATAAVQAELDDEVTAAQTARTGAETARDEAEAFGGTNNTQVAGFVTGAGPTKTALDASIEAQATPIATKRSIALSIALGGN